MSAIESVTLEVEDLAAAERFYAALGVRGVVSLAAAELPSHGFRAYTLSLVVAQPANADLYFNAALEAGAETVKPLSGGLWGHGGVLRAPDGAIWKVATASKKDRSDATQTYEELVLLLGAGDVKASKRFYAARGLGIQKSYGAKYVQFDTPGSAVTLALMARPGLAKDAGVPPDGSGSHRIVIHGDGGAFSDPDGFTWAP